MQFGRVPPAQLSKINFDLPEDPVETGNILSMHAKKKPDVISVYTGCAKWGRKDWIGKIYPKGTKEGDFLHHYALRFNTIELNGMFYQIYGKETILKWKNKVGKDFLFCPKFYSGITHIRRLKNAEKLTDIFLESVYSFGKNLGPCFLQLSDNFTPKDFVVLERYLGFLPKDLEVFVEVRHPDWFVKGCSDDFFSMLESKGKGLVITDAAGRRDCVHARLTVPKTFIRFVGNSLHKTDYTRVDEWVMKLKSWLDKGIHEIYFFMHQHDELHSPELCAYAIEELNKKCKLNLRIPEFVTSSVLF